jgi:NRAMP (natural resistance-associated macrophage protein)-like metal ion transporter
VPQLEANEEKGFWQRLGPGLITGAADDDPSGIATYSQVGAQFGFALLWTMPFSFPLMAAIQEVCARLGRITGRGIAENLRRYYPKSVVYLLVSLLCLANIFNLGADVMAMGAAAQLVFGGPVNLFVSAFGILSLVLEVYVPYRKYVRFLRWLTSVLFAYVIAAFVVHVPWKTVIRMTIIPSLSWTRDYWMSLVAILGTTISPYLFFWQASQEAEDVRLNHDEQPLKKSPSQAFAQFRRIETDTRVGMAFSNLVAFFIILTCAVTLHAAGLNNGIQTAADAAKALEPLAGKLTFSLFALGIVGTGLLAIPVLAGSAAYAVAETFSWHASLESKPDRAPRFYGVLSVATLIGISLSFLGLNPIRALFFSAVINGITAVPSMVILMLISTNHRVVGEFRLPVYLWAAGWIATVCMFLSSLAFALSELRRLFHF